MSLFDILVPGAATNYVKNPGFESWVNSGTINDWSTAGTVTISQVSDYETHGLYSVLLNGEGAGTEGIYQDISGLTAGSSYTLSCYVNNVATLNAIGAFDGGGYTNGTIGVSTTSSWERLSVTKTAPAGGTIRVLLGGTAGISLPYFDRCQLEAGTVVTTYFDGDEPGCFWNGTRHRSTSYRPANERSGGTWTDLDDLVVTVLAYTGLGATDAIIDLQQRSGYDGGEILDARQTSRVVNMSWLFQGTSLANLHTRRQQLMEYILPRAGGKRQPVYFRYRGGANNVIFRGYVEVGLGIEDKRGWFEKALIRVVCEDADLLRDEFASIWVNPDASIFSSAEKNTLYKTGNYVYNASLPTQWNITGGTAGISGPVYAVHTQADGDVWMGGAFITAQDGTVNNIARYNGSSFQAYGGTIGVNSRVESLATDGNDNLYLGGLFTTAGGGTVNYIAKLSSGGTFSAMGVGLNARVRALAVDNDDAVYAGGDFIYDSTGAGTAYNGIAKYASGAWGTVLSGVSGSIYALAYDKANNYLYMGGRFPTLGSGGTVNNLARWDGTTLTGLAAGLSWDGTAWVSANLGVDGTIFALAVAGNGNVFGGGIFPTAGGGTVNNIFEWNGTTYKPLMSGISGTVYGLTLDRDNLLHIVGNFGMASGYVVPGYTTWNGANFSAEGFTIGSGDYLLSVAAGVNGNIYLGGDLDASAKGASGHAVSVTGSANTHPKFTIDAKTTSGSGVMGYIYYITNLTTGAKIYLNLAVRYGEEIIIDTEKSTIWSSLGRDLEGSILSGTSLVDFYLVPGTNYIGISGTVANISVITTWTEREAGV